MRETLRISVGESDYESSTNTEAQRRGSSLEKDGGRTAGTPLQRIEPDGGNENIQGATLSGRIGIIKGTSPIIAEAATVVAAV